jgi:hypothetical protein
MLGKITITPSQLNTEYMYFVKSYNTVKIIYRHPLCNMTQIIVMVPLIRNMYKYYNQGVPKGLLSQIIQMENAILSKWKTMKQPQFHMKPAICHFINHRLTSSETRLVITINGIWENHHQYGVSYFLSSM